MKIRIIFFGFLCGLLLTGAISVNQKGNSGSVNRNILPAPKIILKLDDFGANSSFSCAPALDYLITKEVKASLGVIAERLSINALEVYGKYINAVNSNGQHLFEIWNHGLVHSKNNPPNNNPEFKGTSYAFQKSHFRQSSDLVFQRLGVKMHSFGAPYNANDQTTNDVLNELDEYKVVMFANPQIKNVLNLNNRVNMEKGTGGVDYQYFLFQYRAKKDSYQYMVLQGHPMQWDARRITEFKNIIDFLINEGCEFVLPYEYYLKYAPKPINP